MSGLRGCERSCRLTNTWAPRWVSLGELGWEGCADEEILLSKCGLNPPSPRSASPAKPPPTPAPDKHKPPALPPPKSSKPKKPPTQKRKSFGSSSSSSSDEALPR